MHILHLINRNCKKITSLLKKISFLHFFSTQDENNFLRMIFYPLKKRDIVQQDVTVNMCTDYLKADFKLCISGSRQLRSFTVFFRLSN